jgi:hypothetical protein
MPWRRKSIVVAVIGYSCPHPDDPIEQDVDGENTKRQVQQVQDMFPVLWRLPWRYGFAIPGSLASRQYYLDVCALDRIVSKRYSYGLILLIILLKELEVRIPALLPQAGSELGRMTASRKPKDQVPQ